MNDTLLLALVIPLLLLNAAVFLAKPGRLAGWLREITAPARALSLPVLLGLGVITWVCTLRGGSKSNLLQNAAAPASTNLVAGAGASALLNDTSRTASGLTPAGGAAALSGGPAYLSEAQCAAGFALVCVTNAGPAWLSAPPGAATNALWARRGAAEDAFWLPAEGWSFMLGTNAAEGLYVSSCGALSFSRAESLPGARALPDGTAGGLLAPLLAPLGIAPSRGRFWHAATPSNSLLLTWQDVYAGRDAAAPVTAQAELFWNGDFTFRYAFPSNLPAAFTNFVAGAQHNGGGQTYALGEPGLMTDGLELRWRAFGWLDPALSDHDGDGLDSYDEVMLLGTDPRKTDTDGDGLSDAAETASGSATSPADPDTDGDGLADGLDARPSVWDDLSADADGDGLDLLHERLYGLDPAVSDSDDSDYDGWADWQELLAGTDPANGQVSPSRTDGSDILFDATVTLAADLPCPAVLTVGPHRLVLLKAGSWTLTLKEGVAHAVTLLSARPCAAALSLSFAKGYAALIDPSGIFSGAFASDGRSAASALVAQPSVKIAADPVCFHSDSPKSVSAEILPAELGGTVTWSWPRGSLSAPHSKTTEITWDAEPGQSGIRVSFLAAGAAAAREASAAVSRCTLTDAHPGSGDDAWSQENTLWTAEGATTGNPSDPDPGKACAAPGTAVAVNDDDDDADGVRDLDDTDGVAQDGDLRAAWPFTPYAGGCCLCSAHNPELPESASLVSCSGNLAVYADGSKNGLATSAGRGAAVYLEGLGASAAVGADRLVWEWTENGALRRQTNAYTVLGVRLTGDFNLDGAADAADRALLPSLTNAWGWAMPAATGVCRKVSLRTDVGVAGDLWLRLAGDAGAFRIWTTPSPSATNPPLLACGQTVTNGAGGVSFLTGADTLLYVEAVSNGTAKLTYGFTGSGEAEGLRCAAALGLTGYKIEFDLVSPALGVSTNPPPFAGMREQIFRPDQSPAPDQHAVVLYRDVIDANFNVQDFDVTLVARLTPSVTTEAPFSVHWAKVAGPASGELLATNSLSATYRNPKTGGVYRFRVAIRNGTGADVAFAEANLVLPLAGAEMDSVVQADLVKADLFATSVRDKYSPIERLLSENYKRWFYWGNAGDYVGRPDSETTPSVWYYGQVDTVNRTSEFYGLGAVCTWKGTPVRLAKISNFIVGYAARKIGSIKVLTKAAGVTYGTINGATGNESWDKGWDLAGGENYDAIAINLAAYIWCSEVESDKTKKPWPNPNPPSNDGISSILEGFDYDRQYASPGLTRMLTTP